MGVVNGTVKVWSPTWLNAHKGPRLVTEQEAGLYDDIINPAARGGSFHFGAEADKAFSLLENFITRKDIEEYKGVVKECRLNGKFLAGQPIDNIGCRPHQKAVYSIGEKVWLITFNHVALLGNFEEALDTFPNLFEKV